jgi:hypothetical protein
MHRRCRRWDATARDVAASVNPKRVGVEGWTAGIVVASSVSAAVGIAV